MAGAQLTRLPELLLEPGRVGELEVRGTTAAVLVALFVRDGALHAVFTERQRELSRHAGEISFPGGRRDPEDADLLATALRETHEEIGLASGEVTVLGALQPTSTIATGYAIYPFVGLIAEAQVWRPSRREVSQVLELELASVAGGYARRQLRRRGVPIRTDTYSVDGHVIWGATARILGDLLDRLALTPQARATV